MKKTLIFTAACLTIFLAGCTTQLPAQNQNNNQPTTNQNINLPTVETNQNVNQPVPAWVKTLIDVKKSSPLEDPPSTIKKCTYQNKNVYYVSSPCCDQYNYLYDENNQTICAPDGGLTGRGDGKCTDFSLDKNNCELIWQDSRSK